MKTGTSLERAVEVSSGGPIRAVGGKGFAPGMVASLGRCAKENRNEIVWSRGASGSADEAWGCQKNAADGYAWTLLTPTGSRVQSATIASGAVAVDGAWVTLLVVDTEAGAVSDNLDTINGGAAGHVLTVVAANNARDVVVTSSGNIDLNATGGDATNNNVNDTITLIHNGTQWIEVSRSNNAA